MCINKITQYYGRSGNNLLQILSTIHMIKNNNELNNILYINNHNLFQLINNNIKKEYGNKCNCSTNVFFNKEYLLKLSIYELKNIFKQYLIYNYNLKNKYTNIFDIGIHIRSGDIFKNNGHKLYFQPPLYFYKKIIDENINKKIVIVFENTNNPIINILIDSYKHKQNIVFQSSSINDDIITLSKSKILVFSVGTFSLIPYVISDSIEKVIYPDYFQDNIWFTFNNEKTIPINLPGYIKEQWNNTKSQRKYMIEYKI